MAPTRLTRSGFLLAAGGAAGWIAAPALGGPSEQDLAWPRFAVTVEFVSAAYYLRARSSSFFAGSELRALERANAAENAHLAAFRQTLIDLNEAPIDSADVEVEFPEGAFDSRSGVVSLGRRIETLAVRAYLGAVTTISDQAIRRLFAQVSASEADQLAFLRGLAGPPIGDPFPSVHGLPTAADELARYLP